MMRQYTQQVFYTKAELEARAQQAAWLMTGERSPLDGLTDRERAALDAIRALFPEIDGLCRAYRPAVGVLSCCHE